MKKKNSINHRNMSWPFALILLCFPTLLYGKLPPQYDKDHPYYFKYCTTSQWNPYRDEESGVGIPTGHAVIFLKGACVDHQYDQTSPPELHLCDEKKYDLSNPEVGVGISSDGHFTNTAFLAIPGLTPFMRGDLQEGERLTEERAKQLIESYAKAGYFSGLELKDQYLTPSEKAQFVQIQKQLEQATTPEERKAALLEKQKLGGKLSFGTDYAMSLSRYTYCINVPLNREIMGEVVEHLNAINRSLPNSKGCAWRGESKPTNDFVWDALHNNCAHTAHNALAAAGLVPCLQVDVPLSTQLKNLAIPGKVLLDAHKQSQKLPLDPQAIYDNPKQRRALLEHNWLPLQHDTFVEMLPFHKENEIYKDTAGFTYNHRPYLSVNLMSALIGKFVPIAPLREMANFLDSKAKKIKSLANNPHFAYGVDSPSLSLEEANALHREYFLNQYQRSFERLEKIKKSSSYQKQQKLVSEQKDNQQKGKKVDQAAKEKAKEYLNFMERLEEQLRKQEQDLKNKP
ncbi:MAG: hypothetical protein HQK52_18290 [Oligoflexia bacterium]|nr:hypothetical protein [Oligoflexia bacterium]